MIGDIEYEAILCSLSEDSSFGRDLAEEVFL